MIGYQTTTITPTNATSAIRYSGDFIKVDAIYTDTPDGQIADGTVGRLFYVPSAIPVDEWRW